MYLYLCAWHMHGYPYTKYVWDLRVALLVWDRHTSNHQHFFRRKKPGPGCHREIVLCFLQKRETTKPRGRCSWCSLPAACEGHRVSSFEPEHTVSIVICPRGVLKLRISGSLPWSVPNRGKWLTRAVVHYGMNGVIGPRQQLADV